jgi:hypothetical protein
MKTRLTAPMLARRGDPRGQVLVLFALMLVVLLLVSALAVDYGGWLVTKRNYQNVSDSASLAGAQYLTRQPVATTCPGFGSKNACARQAAWESVKSALKMTALNPAAQAGVASNVPYTEGGYTVWVASPPADANVGCSSKCPYPGHVSGPGTVFVRVDHQAPSFLSGTIGASRTVSAWATAGRFPANFAVIGMCSPTSVTANCLAGDANIKLDGNGTNLIVGTGDLGTNRWTKVGGNNSGVALGNDSNAFMQLFDTCWANASNQCQLWNYISPNIDYSITRAAVPLGAPIADPMYPAPPVTNITTPNQCRGAGTVQLASTQVLEHDLEDDSIQLAAAREPVAPGSVTQAASVKVDGTVLYGGVGVVGVKVDIMNGAAIEKSDVTGAGGAFSMNGVTNGTYTVRVSDSSDLYNTITVGPYDMNANTVVPPITLVKNALVQGTVTNSATSTGIVGATVTITALGVNYTATTTAGGAYSRRVPSYGNTVAYSIAVTAPGFGADSGSVAAPTGPLEVTYTRNFALVPIPASLMGTITDQVTGLPVPGVLVTLGTGGSATTNASGVYNIPAATVGTTTVTLDPTTMVGYAYSTPTSGSNITIAGGANTRNFTLWPKGCYDGGSSGSFGSWSCSWPSGNNCPATTNLNGSNVTCTFTQANAIRPGTYKDITLPNGTCAWLDPRGGQTGLAANQSAGIYHIKGTISLGSDSYLFGDGVTLVMDQGSDFDVNNGGGFVLNYGTHNTSGNPACPVATDLSTPYLYGETGNFCFRTTGAATTEDYNYAARTSQGHFNWSNATFPTFDDVNVVKGQEMGVTFYMYGSGLGNASRMKLATANMGYLFNGVLYAPNDDIQLGGGKDGQSAAGQLVGWTIEYHGGTRILQNWYGDPVDGQPFLIEPILGE